MKIPVKAPSGTMRESVMKWVLAIPEGKVATYGQIARLCERAQQSSPISIMVNRFKDSSEIPAYRVIRSDGSIKFQKGSVDYKRQKSRLEAEGVEVDENGLIDLEKFGWKKEPRKLSKKEFGGRPLPKMFS